MHDPHPRPHTGRSVPPPAPNRGPIGATGPATPADPAGPADGSDPAARTATADARTASAASAPSATPATAADRPGTAPRTTGGGTRTATAPVSATSAAPAGPASTSQLPDGEPALGAGRTAAADAAARATVPGPRTAPPTAGPLEGMRVLDLATLFAGPSAATLLGDFGADVVKVEHPRKPDPSRGHGPSKDGVGLWWKHLGRNKRNITLDLSTPGGRDVLLKLAASTDVIIENFRPGTLERWGLGWEELSAANPRLVLARVTAFGQFGPYSARPGFGTLAEAMSGFASATGEPEGPPTLPPFGLADSVAALATAYAVMAALAGRDRTGAGQVVDMAIIEPMLAVLGPQLIWYDQLGYVQPRMGNRSTNNAPRNTYRTADGAWLAVSSSAQSIAERVMRLVGRPELVEEPWFATGTGRAAHAEEIDAAVGTWIAAHDRDEVVSAFEKAQAAVAPIYDVRDVMTDPQYGALGTVASVEDAELGPMRMQNVLFRLSGTPGAIRWTGRPHGSDTDAVLTELGLNGPEIAALREEGAL